MQANPSADLQDFTVHSKPAPTNATGASDATGASNAPTSEELKARLRAVFDGQIPNYGDYNLVCGSSTFAAPGPGPRGRSPRRRRTFVIGYRWHPTEVVIAPFDDQALTAASVPVTINMTNLAHAVRLPLDGYEVAASTGKAFRFGVEESMTLNCAREGQTVAGPSEQRQIEQPEDAADFHAFMADFVQRGLPF